MLQLGARYYWPEIGRFISQDPIRDGNNWYMYAGDNPVVAVDPDGKKLWDPECAKNAAKHALRDAEQEFPGSLHNGPGDAYRHCLWSCKMQRECGSFTAWAAGVGHELTGWWQPLNEAMMDNMNNAIGRSLGKKCPTNPKNCEDACKDRLKEGGLVTTLETPWL